MIKLIQKLVIFSLLVIATLVVSDTAVNTAKAQASNETQLPFSVRQAENYLRTLKSARADFIQTNPDGYQLDGTFYLSRPGRLRFEYDQVDDFVVADGIFIYFYDAELEQQSNAPIGQTLADFLLRKDLNFSGDISIADVKKGNKYLQIALVQTADPEAGRLVLGFTEDPFELKKWRVIDATGSITEVELLNTEKNVKLDRSLFVYKDPKAGDRNDFNE